jgi:Tol biopolymer transport system component/DNA-binding winged helix-turn-helix (wHTH) protein
MGPRAVLNSGLGGVMASAPNGNRRIQFGIFEVDLKAGELRRNGTRVRLQEQPFQILTILLEHSGEVVTREELRGRLWPADTYVDFDHSLNAAVRRLRDALGDSAENPRFVETVARRGYRLLAPVNGTTTAAPQPQLVARSFGRRWWWVAAGSVAVLAGVIVGWHAGHHSSSAARAINERRLTANASENPVTDGVISPDGKYLAFADAVHFFLRQIDTGETHVISLPTGFNAKPRSWFPDGTHLLATGFASPREPSSIWEISLIGGSPRKLIEQGSWPAVSPDGSKVVFLTAETQNAETQNKEIWAMRTENREIWLMQANGEGARKLIEGGEGFFGAPAWAPDGRHLAYIRHRYKGGMPWIRSRLEILDISSGHTNDLLETPELGSTVAWAPDGRLIYSLGEPSPNQNDSNLWALPLDSAGHVKGPATRLTHGPGFADLVSVTLDGKRLAFFRRTIEPDVYVTDLEANGTKLSEPRRLTLDERADFPYSWTPDSKSIIFVSDRNGAYDIFKQRLDDSEPELVVRGQKENKSVARLTPDSKSVLYIVTPTEDTSTLNQSRLMRASLAGGPPQMVLTAVGLGNQQCARSPATLCIFTVIEPGIERFFTFDPEKGAGHEIPKAAIKSLNKFEFNWSLSPDGQMLAMTGKSGDHKEPAIRLFLLQDETERTIAVPGWVGISSLDWGADSKSIWMTGYASGGTKTLVNVSVMGRIRPMLEEKKMTLGWAIPSPDGKHLALWKASGSSNVWMLENF